MNETLPTPTADTPATTPVAAAPAAPVGWLRHLWWFALPAGCWLLDRLFLVRASGEPIGDVPRAAVLGIVFLLVQPIALAMVLRRLDRASPTSWRRQLGHGAIHTGAFAAVATLTLWLLWRGNSPDAGTLLGSLGWWISLGGFWLGVWIGLRAMRVPAVATQVGIGLAAALLATNLFWINHRLTTLGGTPEMGDAIDRAVEWSPLHGWLHGVLGLHIFRQGRMYINPDGEPLSVIGEFITGAPEHAPRGLALGLRWLLLGLGLAAVGLLSGRARFKRREP
ncbi:MAG: hypothetical protein AB7S36_03940 [Planctomycetota bacterium]